MLLAFFQFQLSLHDTKSDFKSQLPKLEKVEYIYAVSVYIKVVQLVWTNDIRRS